MVAMLSPPPSRRLSSSAHLEEFASAVTHAIGLILSILGLFWLSSTAFATGDPWKVSSALLFGGSLVLLYGASTLYHSFQEPTLKHQLRIFDHCAIYLLIAGSYTPFALITLGGSWGWSLFILEWLFAAIGIYFKISSFHGSNLLSTLFYLAMGWLIIFAASPLLDNLSHHGLYLLVAGGLSYTLGSLIYLLEKPLFHHAIWHLFVMGGSACHYFSVLLYVF